MLESGDEDGENCDFALGHSIGLFVKKKPSCATAPPPLPTLV